MKKTILFNIAFTLLLMQQSHAQDCKTNADLEATPGKYIDAVHCEWPQQKAHWLDALSPVEKVFASKALTQIETLESNSRKNYVLKGADLKSTFGTTANAKQFFGKNWLTSYDLNLGCYEYFCYKNKQKVSDEYANVFRAYVNEPNRRIENPFTFGTDYPFYEEYNKYNGKFIALCNFFTYGKTEPNNAKGYYQDVPESKVKPGNRSVFMTRHWYFAKNNIAPFVPVTRKEYLEALLVYYDREALYTADKIKEEEKQSVGMMKNQAQYPQLYEDGKKQLTVIKAKYPDWAQKIATKRALVQKALKENTPQWLAKPAIVNPKKENFSYKSYYGQGANDYVTIDGYYADTPNDAKNTGSFTFSGFWDDKGGVTLYKYNDAYFAGAEKNRAKSYFIELTYRYVNTPLGKSLVENFTENFDFDAVRKMLE